MSEHGQYDRRHVADAVGVGIAFVSAGVTLALGWMTQGSPLVLLFALIPVTVAIHVVPDASHVGPLFKNIAFFGALLFFSARGPGADELDNWGRGKDPAR